MLEMEPGEYGSNWPDSVKNELPCMHPKLIEHLNGERGRTSWLEAKRLDITSGDLLFRSLQVPSKPPRLARSSTWHSVYLRANCRVDRVEEHRSELVIVSSDGTENHRHSVDFAVVCAGALNSPLILQKSGMGFPYAGRHLTDHPMGLVAKLAIGDHGALNALLARPKGFRSVIKVRDEASGLWASFQLCPTHDLSFDEDHYLANANGGGARLLRPRGLFTKLRSSSYRELWANKAFGRDHIGRCAYVLAMLEQEPAGCGSVTADAAGRISLSWDISDASVAALDRSLHKLSACLGAELHLPPSGIASRLWSGAHHAGSCRISLNAETGVVDDDLRVHEQQRIYVCDASVLPSTGASHTGLTIASLAIRLSGHLRRRFTAQVPEGALESA
jgi:hypothetical protein